MLSVGANHLHVQRDPRRQYRHHALCVAIQRRLAAEYRRPMRVGPKGGRMDAATSQRAMDLCPERGAARLAIPTRRRSAGDQRRGRKSFIFRLLGRICG